MLRAVLFFLLIHPIAPSAWSRRPALAGVQGPVVATDSVLLRIKAVVERIDANEAPLLQQETYDPDSLLGPDQLPGNSSIFVLRISGEISKITVSTYGPAGAESQIFYFNNGALLFAKMESAASSSAGSLADLATVRMYFDGGTLVRLVDEFGDQKNLQDTSSVQAGEGTRAWANHLYSAVKSSRPPSEVPASSPQLQDVTPQAPPAPQAQVSTQPEASTTIELGSFEVWAIRILIGALSALAMWMVARRFRTSRLRREVRPNVADTNDQTSTPTFLDWTRRSTWQVGSAALLALVSVWISRGASTNFRQETSDTVFRSNGQFVFRESKGDEYATASTDQVLTASETSMVVVGTFGQFGLQLETRSMGFRCTSDRPTGELDFEGKTECMGNSQIFTSVHWSYDAANDSWLWSRAGAKGPITYVRQ